MTRLLSILFFLSISSGLLATETKVTIRVKARDAKFVGSSIGGAYVVVRNKLTGEILAQGRTEGSTGNTGIIMNAPWERGKRLTDDNTAKFQATIDLTEPTFVSLEVKSPVNQKQAAINASTELWLIPGKHILGDGIVMEIPGFVVNVLEPRTHQYISLASIESGSLVFRANVVMMCGCPISVGGTWDAEKMEVTALIKQDGGLATELPLSLVETNLFEGQFTVKGSGQYEVVVYAYDEATGNTGVDKVNFIIREEDH